MDTAPPPAPAPRPAGVYVHFPYCAYHCPYCDFAVAVVKEIPQRRYADAVLSELRARAPGFAGLRFVSLYLGGGTPSLWEPGEVARVIAAVRAAVALDPAAEITLEVNPESADPARLRAWREAGVNRFSIGVQSFDPGVLAKLGRRHGPAQAEAAVRAAAAVVEDVAVDVIYGARRSTVASAAADGARLAALPVTHVSAYALTVEGEALAEETPFVRLRRAGRLPLPEDEEVLAQGRALRAALRRAGLRRYEVSNLARPGFEAVHNALYWASESYLGLGCGASGCLHRCGGGGGAPAAALRWANHRAPEAYLAAVEAGEAPTAEEDRLGPEELHEEEVLLALRVRAGLPVDRLRPAEQRELPALLRRRLAVVRGGRVVLTSRGLDLHGAVVARLLGAR